MLKKHFLFSIMLAAVLTPFVSAAFPALDIKGLNVQFIETTKEFFTPFFEALLNTSSYDDFFFAKILLFLLVFIVVFSVLVKVDLFKEKKKFPGIVSFIVSILAIRFMPNEFVGGILLPYSTLGIAITTFIPFLVYFWFVHKSGGGHFGRRIAWILYGLVFVLVWYTRPEKIVSDASDLLYFAGFAAVALSFIFDKNIHEYFGTATAAKMTRRFKLKHLADLEHDIAKYRAIPDPSRETQILIRHLEYKYQRLLGEL